jgi:hypothetical protein
MTNQMNMIIGTITATKKTFNLIIEVLIDKEADLLETMLIISIQKTVI